MTAINLFVNAIHLTRLNCIHHLLSKVPYEDMTPPALKLPPRKSAKGYVRPPINEQFFVPNCYP